MRFDSRVQNGACVTVLLRGERAWATRVQFNVQVERIMEVFRQHWGFEAVESAGFAEEISVVEYRGKYYFTSWALDETGTKVKQGYTVGVSVTAPWYFRMNR